MFLDLTNSTIEVVLGEAQTTACGISCDWVDYDATTTTPGATKIASNGVTAVTALAAPGSGHQRKVNLLTVYNADNVAHTVTVQRNDAATITGLFKATVNPGQTLQFTDTAGFSVPNVNTAGCYVKTTVLTAASGTFTTQANTRSIFIRGVGGGGGGGGCTSVAAAASAGGGGGGGGYAEKTFTVLPGTGYSYTCGAAGTGVSGAAGNNGGNSTFVVGGVTVTAYGGGGAVVATALTTPCNYRGGNGGAVSTNGDLNAGGQPGHQGVLTVVATPLGVGGPGGSSAFGGGGNAVIAAGNGTAGVGYGAGGSGGLTGASAARTGGNGTAGCWVVDEYT